jgi:predicted metalloprotease
VGFVIVDDVVAKYDVKVVYSLLLQVYLHLNPMKTKIEPTIIEDDDCFLWAIFFC